MHGGNRWRTGSGVPWRSHPLVTSFGHSRSQETRTWDVTHTDALDDVMKARSSADWRIVLVEHAQTPALSTKERQHSFLDDLPAFLSAPMYLQSLLSRPARSKERQALENAPDGDHRARLLGLGSPLSGFFCSKWCLPKPSIE